MATQANQKVHQCNAAPILGAFDDKWRTASLWDQETCSVTGYLYVDVGLIEQLLYVVRASQDEDVLLPGERHHTELCRLPHRLHLTSTAAARFER